MCSVPPRLTLTLLSCLLALAARPRAAHAQPLDVQVTSVEGCPGEDWFRAELLRSNVQRAVRVTLSRSVTGEFSGEISFPDGLLFSSRRLSGPLCQTVADGLILIAGVHILPPPLPPPTAAPVAARPLVFALGATLLGDTSLPRTLSFGGGAGVWLSRSPEQLRGLLFQALYSGATVDSSIPVRLDHLRARLDLLPLAAALGPSLRVGVGPHVAGGGLRARASLASRNVETRAVWSVGLSSRLRADAGPLWLDLDLAASLSLTRRRFEVTGLDQPLFTLPPWSASASLSVWFSPTKPQN